ncbi:MAG: TRAP transporter small permease [Paracoccus sp. BP8]|nr:MAG: TRAP transporter small permease [Paracoccus sp. BP8]
MTSGGVLQYAGRSFQFLENLAALIGGGMMIAAMVLISLDAILRYTISAPLVFVSYLMQYYLLVGMLTMPMAWGFRTGGYIRISFFAMRLSDSARDLLLRVGMFAGAIYSLLLAWLGGKHFWDVFQRGDIQMGVIDWPVSWSWVWVPIGLGLLAIRMLIITFGPAAGLYPNETISDEVA